MASHSRIYIAGVGVSPSGGSSAEDAAKSLVSAATKALLDAGITYDDVTRGVTSARSDANGTGKSVFDVFDKGAVDVDEVKKGSELETAFNLVKDHSHCVLAIVIEKSTAIAFVLVPDMFLWRRPYLKDSAALIGKADTSQASHKGAVSKGFHDVCKMVWTLRGWSHSQGKAGEEGHLHYQAESGKGFEFRRADGKSIPEWKDVEHKQDGKYRLGHNPARDTREISQEDFEAVRAGGKHQKKTESQIQFTRKGGDRAALARL